MSIEYIAAGDSTESLRSLDQHYKILENSQLVTEALDAEPALSGLLSEAVPPLQAAFGERRMLHIRAQYSDDERMLKVTVQLPVAFGDPEPALLSFDRNWWLDNCHRSGGALVFDYEIQDAF